MYNISVVCLLTRRVLIVMGMWGDEGTVVKRGGYSVLRVRYGDGGVLPGGSSLPEILTIKMDSTRGTFTVLLVPYQSGNFISCC